MLGDIASVVHFLTGHEQTQLTLLQSERPKLYGVLAILSAIGLNPVCCFHYFGVFLAHKGSNYSDLVIVMACIACVIHVFIVINKYVLSISILSLLQYSISVFRYRPGVCRCFSMANAERVNHHLCWNFISE